MKFELQQKQQIQKSEFKKSDTIHPFSSAYLGLIYGDSSLDVPVPSNVF